MRYSSKKIFKIHVRGTENGEKLWEIGETFNVRRT